MALIKASSLSSSLSAWAWTIDCTLGCKYSFGSASSERHGIKHTGTEKSSFVWGGEFANDSGYCDFISEFVLWLTQDSKLEIYFSLGHHFYLDESVRKERRGEGGGRGRGPLQLRVWHHGRDPGPALCCATAIKYTRPRPAALQCRACRGRESRVLQHPGNCSTACRAGGIWRYEARLRWQDFEEAERRVLPNLGRARLPRRPVLSSRCE